MKKELKGFTVGVITAALLFATAFTAFAEPVGKTISVLYDNIKIFVDGNRIEPKDAAGSPVEPFTYNGTTYLPVRAIAQALGKRVEWDGSTNSVHISSEPGSEIQEITVETAEEFVKAIGSNRRILLKPGVYDLSAAEQTDSADGTVTWMNVRGGDGKELNIQGIYNLAIECIGDGKAEFKVTSRYAYVMKFKNSRNITIKNISAGHAPLRYECDAGVLRFDACENVTISDSLLYGCGSIGVVLQSVKNMDVVNTEITDCSLRAVQIYDSQAVRFKDSRITDHRAYSNIININWSKDIAFEGCTISGNSKFEWAFMEMNNSSMVRLDKCIIADNSKTSVQAYEKYKISFFDTESCSLIVKDTIFRNNKCDYLASRKSEIVFYNCTFEGNTFTNEYMSE